jgi:hypothetical protein
VIHYTCDFCGAPIPPDEPRFEVRIEVRLAPDEIDDDWTLEDLCADCIDSLDLDCADLDLDPGGETLHALRFDLCPDCQQAFLSTPPPPAPQPNRLSFEYNN